MYNRQHLPQQARGGEELEPRRFESLSALVPQSAKLTLGRHVVVVDTFNHLEEQRLDDTMAARSVDDIDIATDSKLFALRNDIKRRETSTISDLECVRKKVSRLDSKERRLFDEYCDSITSPFLRGLKDAADEDGTLQISWSDWLGEQAGDRQLMNFLQWHNYAMEQIVMHPEVAEEIESQRSEYKQSIATGIDEDWLHPGSQGAIETTDSTATQAGDLFGTTFEERGGYYRRGSREVVAAAIRAIPSDGNYEAIRKEFSRITKHELNHAVLGRFDVRWLDEAVTEHIALVMEDGNPESLNPWRHRFGGGYKHERDLLSALLEGGDQKIPVKMATRAYSEPEASGPELTAFIKAIDKSWSHLAPDGDSAYANLNMYMENLERSYREEGLKQIAAGKKAAEKVAYILNAYRMQKDAKADPKQNWRLAKFKQDIEEQIREVFGGKNFRLDREKIAA